MNSERRVGEQQVQRSRGGTVFHDIQEIKNMNKEKEKEPGPMTVT